MRDKLEVNVLYNLIATYVFAGSVRMALSVKFEYGYISCAGKIEALYDVQVELLGLVIIYGCAKPDVPLVPLLSMEKPIMYVPA